MWRPHWRFWQAAPARHALWLILFTLLTGYKSWPLIAHLSDRILGDAGDPYLNAAILQWNYCTLFASGDWAAYRNLPFFYPHDNVLAWSEHLFGFAVLGWPVQLLTKNPACTYNILILSTLILNGWSMCWLAYDRTRRMLPAILAGLTLYSAHYFIYQQGHIQCLPIFWGVLALLAIHRWERSWAVRSAFLAGLCAAMLLLSGANLGAFFGVIFWLVVLILFIRRGAIGRLRPWVGLAAAALPSLVAYTLFFRDYAPTNQIMGHYRDLSEIRAYSAHPKHLITIIESIPVWLGRTDDYSVTGEPSSIAISIVPALMFLLAVRACIRRKRRAQTPFPWVAVAWLVLFPITLVMSYNMRAGPGWYFVLAGHPYFLNWSRALSAALAVLACIGLTVELMRRGKLAQPIGLYIWITALTLVLSFGPQIRWHDHELLLAPYAVLLKLLPALEGIRVPARFAAITFIGLAMLTALGLHSLRKRRIQYYVIAVLIGTGLAFEWREGKLDLAPFRDRADLGEAADWVAQAQPGAVVVHLPLPPERSWRIAAYETPRILSTIPAALNGLRTMNGYSGYSSRTYEWMLDHWSGAWTQEHVEQGIDLGANYVLLDRSLPGAQEIGLDELDRIQRVRTFGQVEVYRLSEATPPQLVPAAHIWALGAQVDSRDGGDQVPATLKISLPAPADHTLYFRDRYLGEVVLSREGAGPTTCGSAYLDTPFLLPGQTNLRAHLRLRSLPLFAGDLDESRYTWSLRVPEYLPIPPAGRPGAE